MSDRPGQPSPPPGWGVMAPDGSQIGKLTASYFTEQEPADFPSGV